MLDNFRLADPEHVSLCRFGLKTPEVVNLLRDGRSALMRNVVGQKPTDAGQRLPDAGSEARKNAGGSGEADRGGRRRSKRIRCGLPGRGGQWCGWESRGREVRRKLDPRTGQVEPGDARATSIKRHKPPLALIIRGVGVYSNRRSAWACADARRGEHRARSRTRSNWLSEPTAVVCRCCQARARAADTITLEPIDLTPEEGLN